MKFEHQLKGFKVSIPLKSFPAQPQYFPADLSLQFEYCNLGFEGDATNQKLEMPGR